mgnify:CR=1 FL=1
MKHLRVNYTKGELVEGNFTENPFDLFTEWFEDAQSSESVKESNAMVLSTVNGDAVDSRIVLLKDVRGNQFVFYTNYNSHKGQQIAQNSNCTLVFPWIGLERQVIIRGKASKNTLEESIDYFLSRPKSSQIGAWASTQSQKISSRADLESQLKFYEQKFDNKEVTKPEHWGGYEIDPLQIEFWQGRENRLHDRILFEKKGDKWSVTRLQP